jgi:ubiquitin-like 1-activating enzyme E1 A
LRAQRLLTIFLQRAEAALPGLQKLNPRVNIIVDPVGIAFRQDPQYFAQFDLTITTDVDAVILAHVNTATRLAKCPLYSAGVHGMYGYIFADLLSHEYIMEREKSNQTNAPTVESATRSIVSIAAKPEKVNGKSMEIVTKREQYCPLLLANTSPLSPDYLKDKRKMRKVSPLLSCMRALWDFERNYNRRPSSATPADLQEFTVTAKQQHQMLQLPLETLTSDILRSFIQNLGGELAPVTAFVGGQLAQDVINFLGKREQPIQNFLFFNGEDCTSNVYCLYTNPDELGAAMTPAVPSVDDPVAPVADAYVID